MKLDSIEVIFFFIGLGFLAARIPQITKLVKRKTSGDISLLYWCIVTTLILPWIWYAIYRAKSTSMVCVYSIMVMANLIVINLICRYRKK